jgi:hypothetical protein
MSRYIMIIFLILYTVLLIDVFKDLSTVKTNVLIITGGLK